MSRVERIQTAVHDNCLVFRHHAKKALADHEVVVFCDLPQFRDEKSLIAVPNISYTLNNLKDSTIVLLFTPEMGNALKDHPVEVQVFALPEDERVVLTRSIKGVLNQTRRDISELKRILNRIAVLERADKVQRKYMGGTRGKGHPQERPPGKGGADARPVDRKVDGDKGKGGQGRPPDLHADGTGDRRGDAPT